MSRVQGVPKACLFSVPFLLVLVPVPVGAEDPVPYSVTDYYSGVIGSAAAYQVEVPTHGCVIEDIPDVWVVKSCGGIRNGGENGEVAFEVNESAGIRTIIVELEWIPSFPMNERLALSTLCPAVPRGTNGAVVDPEHPCYFEAIGESVLQIRVDDGHWAANSYDPNGDWAARVFAAPTALGTHDMVGVDVGAAYEPPFQLYVSRFFHEPAPEGWSAIPS